MTVSEPVALEIVGALSGLIRTARSYSHLRHEQLGPTGIALAILKRLHEEPSRSGDIACALGVSASAVSRAVATVESFGYIARQPDPVDARASVLPSPPPASSSWPSSTVSTPVGSPRCSTAGTTPRPDRSSTDSPSSTPP